MKDNLSVQVEIFEAVGRALTGSLDLGTMLALVARLVVDKLGYRNCAILLHNSEQHEFYVHTIVGNAYEPVAGRRFDETAGISGEVLRLRRTVIVPNTAAEPLYISGQPDGARGGSEISVPISFGDEVIGLLDCEAEETGAFDENDSRLLEALAAGIGPAIRNSRLYARARRWIEELESILEVSTLLSSSSSLEILFDRILEHAGRITDSPAGTITLYNHETKLMELRAARGLEVTVSPEARWILREGGLTQYVMRRREPLVVNDVARSDFCDVSAIRQSGIAAFVAVPLFSGEQFNGVLFVDDFTPRRYPPDDVRVLAILANSASTAIDNARLQAQLARYAFTDALMGLANRRSFQENLDRELKRALRYQHAVSLAMFDLDHFKRYNDAFGHPAGDEALALLAQTMRLTIRDTDFPARYGGEELAVIFPETDCAEATTITERVRQAVEQLPFGPGLPLLRRLTISAGVAGAPEDAAGPGELVAKADEALYHAKHRGRNRVYAWSEIKKLRGDAAKPSLPEIEGFGPLRPLH